MRRGFGGVAGVEDDNTTGEDGMWLIVGRGCSG